MSKWIRPLGATTLAAALTAGVLVPMTLASAPASAASSVTGVDVSSWQHPNSKASDINWSKVAGAGHDFAIIKATESTTYTNPFYASDVANARAAGLVVGAYHFARPKLPLSSAQDQARYFVNVTGKMRTAKTLPPVLDIEANGGLSKTKTIAWAQSFLSTVRQLTGRTPMIYSYDSFLRTSLNNSTAFKGYPLWYAKYSTTPPGSLPGGWNTWTIWQYTSQGSVAGLKGDIDVNKFNGTKSALLRLADGTKAAPIAPGAPTNLVAGLTWPDATLTWDAPTTDGGSPITKYVVSVDGGVPGSTPTRSSVAGPLEPGTHTFDVRAVTIAATGPPATLSVTIPTPTPGTTAGPPAASTVSIATATTASRGVNQAVTATLRRADTLQVVPNELVTITLTPKKGAKRVYRLLTNTNGTATAVVTHRTHGTVRAVFGGDSRLTNSSSKVSVLVRPKPSIKLSKSTVRKNTKVKLSGSVSSLYRGETVKRQRYYAGAWRTVATAKVRSTGTYAFTIKPTAKKTYKYRVRLEATPLHLRGDSKTKKLRVR